MEKMRKQLTFVRLVSTQQTPNDSNFPSSETEIAALTLVDFSAMQILVVGKVGKLNTDLTRIPIQFNSLTLSNFRVKPQNELEKNVSLDT
jgi:hypothetical protein